MSSASDGLTTVSFDGDGTLWDFQKVIRRSLRRALAELRRLAPGAADSLTIDKMIALRDEVATELKGKVTNLEEVRLAAFGGEKGDGNLFWMTVLQCPA